jgi:hypothetical protein
VIQNVWAWVKNYDGARGGYPSPSTILLTGVIAAVLGVVALAKDLIGLGTSRSCSVRSRSSGPRCGIARPATTTDTSASFRGLSGTLGQASA